MSDVEEQKYYKEDQELSEYNATYQECQDQVEYSFQNYKKEEECDTVSDSHISDTEHINSKTAVDKPKMLIQRVFHQTAKNVVEQQLEYIIADSEHELTKLVFGGLFGTKYYAYSPENYCKKHPSNLFEYKNEDLPKLGDKFDSLETFRLYIDGNAKKWKYYLKVADSHRKGKDTFVFKCVFSRQKYKYNQPKGLRQRTDRVQKTDCPCRIFLKPLVGSKDLTVVYVCNHHDHPLKDNIFNQLQHGRRLHPSVKEEMMDLISLDVDKEVIMKHFEALTGFSMTFGYIGNLKLYMKKHKIERQFSLEQLKEMYKKIERIKQELGLSYEKENEDNPDSVLGSEPNKSGTSAQIEEVFHVLNAVSTRRKTRRKKNPIPEMSIANEVEDFKPKKRKKEDVAASSNNQSRLETRLQELTHDRETLQSVKHLQDSVRCETNRNPWVEQDIIPWNRTATASSNKQHNSPLKQLPTKERMEQQVIETAVETKQEDIETSLCTDDLEQNQDFFYENEVIVTETTNNNNLEYTVYDAETELSNQFNTDINTTEYVETVGESGDYCIQYDTGSNEQGNDSYIFIENLDNLPVQVYATELAKVNIIPKTEDTADQPKDVVAEGSNNVIVKTEDTQNCHIDKLIFELHEDTLTSEKIVYEVIETNNKKILPSRDVVNSVILNKKSKDPPIKKTNINTLKQKPINKSKKPNCRRREQQLHMPNIKEEPLDYNLDDLKDDEHILIVVNEETSTNLDFSINRNDKCIQCNMNNSKDITEIEEVIVSMKRKKRSLKEEVEYLQDTKERLLKEIAQAKKTHSLL